MQSVEQGHSRSNKISCKSVLRIIHLIKFRLILLYILKFIIISKNFCFVLIYLTVCYPPRSAPQIEKRDPIWQCDLKLQVEPIAKKSKIETFEPILTLENAEKLLPAIPTFLIERVEPKFAKFNIDRELPYLMLENADI